MRDAGSPTCAAPRADFGRPGRLLRLWMPSSRKTHETVQPSLPAASWSGCSWFSTVWTTGRRVWLMLPYRTDLHGSAIRQAKLAKPPHWCEKAGGGRHADPSRALFLPPMSQAFHELEFGFA